LHFSIDEYLEALAAICDPHHGADLHLFISAE
jgi:hypothetical protein